MKPEIDCKTRPYGIGQGDNWMKFNPEKHHRRSIRLKGYDYSSPGAYFITICTYQRACLFGEIVQGEMQLNQFGHVVRSHWLKLSLAKAIPASQISWIRCICCDA
jgi:hypothetical protein